MPDRESDIQGSNGLERELSAGWITSTRTLLADRTGQWCETSALAAEYWSRAGRWAVVGV